MSTVQSILITCKNFLHFNDETMESLMKAAENFVEETSNTEENFDESLFVDFMKKVPIWEFFCISKQVYLAMSEKEKREKISKYYSDMKNRHVALGEFRLYFVFCSFFFHLTKIFLSSEEKKCLFLLRTIRKLVEFILTDCLVIKIT